MAQRASLWFGVLGPVVVRRGGEVLPLRGPRERALLGLLLADCDRAVPVPRLVDGMWGATPPPTAEKTLQSYISRLRRLVEPDSPSAGWSVIVTTPSGYSLRTDAATVDVYLFLRLVEQGRSALAAGAPELALARLRTALRLWRGRAYEDLPDTDFAVAERDRLDELRLAAVADRIDAELALGHAPTLVGELQRLVADHPLRERFRGHLMIALYESGRQAEALEAYRSARTRLVAEIGVEPAPGLRALEAAILAERPSLLPKVIRPPGVPSALDADRNPLVGRDVDLRWLERAWQRVLTGAGETVVVAGEPGMGASRLVAEFARTVGGRGAAVILGPANAETLAETTTERPVLVVLDDPTSVDPLVVERLAVAVARLPVLVLVTAAPDQTERLAGAVEATAVLRLDPLGVEQVRAVVAGYVSGDDLPAAAAAVATSSRGVPARVHEHAASWAAARAGERVGRTAARVATGRRDLVAVEHAMIADVLDLQRARTRRRDVVPAGSGDRAAVRTETIVCPYKGLARFDEPDAAFFFGRERLVAQLVTRCAAAPLLAVVGPSGSGKSSVVRAGLVPALRSGILPGSDEWRIRLLRTSAIEPAALWVDGGIDGDGNGDGGGASGGASGGELLVLDQFEEAFTSWPARDREELINRLVRALDRRDGLLRAVLTVRSDYYGRFARHPALAGLIADNTLLVGPMVADELRRAIEEPARVAGLDLETGFADAVVADVQPEPGALPLLSTALLATWERRDGRELRIAAYREAGGVAGAITRLADGVYEGLDPAGQAILRRVFLRLADLGDGRDDVRRRTPRSELAGSEQVEAVLDLLIRRRLVIVTGDTVEVAHEALLREWPRLRGWLEQDRDGRRVHRHLTEATRAWEAAGRDPADVLRGARLQAAQEWATAHPDDANPAEQEFLLASSSARQDTLLAARRTARRLTSLAAGLAIVLVVALVAGGLAVVHRDSAVREAARANAASQSAQAGRLAALARTLGRDQTDLAMLLAVEGHRLHPAAETEGGLEAVLARTPPGLEQVIRFDWPTFYPVVPQSASPDGRLLAVPGQDGTVRLWDLAAGRVQRTLSWRTPRQVAAFSPDGKFLAVGGIDGTVLVWNVTSGELAGAPIAAGGGFSYGVFDPDDSSRLFTANDNGEIVAWDRSLPQRPRRASPPLSFAIQPGAIPIVVINRDGSRLAASTFPGTSTRVWNVASGEVIRDLPGLTGFFGPDLVTLPTALGDRVVLWNIDTGQEQGPPLAGFTSAAPGMIFSADGRHLAANDGADFIRVFDLDSRKQTAALVQQDRATTPTKFLPDGRLIASGVGETNVWRLDRTLPPIGRVLRGHQGAVGGTFVPGSDEIVTVGLDDSQLLRWDVGTGSALGPLLDGAVRAPVAFRPDGAVLTAARGRDNAIALWDRTANTELAVLAGTRGGAGSHVAWSPVGDRVATTSDGAVQLWDVTDPRHPVPSARLDPAGMPHPGEPDNQYPYFSHNGRWLAVEDIPGRTVTVFDAATGQRRWWVRLPASGPPATAFSSDDETLAVGVGTLNAGEITLYNADSGAPEGSLQTPSSGGVEFLRGGAMVMTTSISGAASVARLWDTATLTPIGESLPQPTGSAFSISRNATGTAALVGSTEGHAVLWDFDPSRWEAIACQIAGRNMSPAEWRQYLPGEDYRRTCRQWPEAT